MSHCYESSASADGGSMTPEALMATSTVDMFIRLYERKRFWEAVIQFWPLVGDATQNFNEVHDALIVMLLAALIQLRSYSQDAVTQHREHAKLKKDIESCLEAVITANISNASNELCQNAYAYFALQPGSSSTLVRDLESKLDVHSIKTLVRTKILPQPSEGVEAAIAHPPPHSKNTGGGSKRKQQQQQRAGGNKANPNKSAVKYSSFEAMNFTVDALYTYLIHELKNDMLCRDSKTSGGASLQQDTLVALHERVVNNISRYQQSDEQLRRDYITEWLGALGVLRRLMLSLGRQPSVESENRPEWKTLTLALPPDMTSLVYQIRQHKLKEELEYNYERMFQLTMRSHLKPEKSARARTRACGLDNTCYAVESATTKFILSPESNRARELCRAIKGLNSKYELIASANLLQAIGCLITEGPVVKSTLLRDFPLRALAAAGETGAVKLIDDIVRLGIGSQVLKRDRGDQRLQIAESFASQLQAADDDSLCSSQPWLDLIQTFLNRCPNSQFSPHDASIISEYSSLSPANFVQNYELELPEEIHLIDAERLSESVSSDTLYRRERLRVF